MGAPGERPRGVPPAPFAVDGGRRGGEGLVARVVAVSADLMLGSRVDGALSAAGHEVALSASLAEASLEGADLIVADLDGESAEALAAAGVPVLGYYSHVDVETRRAAEAAGVDAGRAALADGARAAGPGRGAAGGLRTVPQPAGAPPRAAPRSAAGTPHRPPAASRAGRARDPSAPRRAGPGGRRRRGAGRAAGRAAAPPVRRGRGRERTRPGPRGPLRGGGPRSGSPSWSPGPPSPPARTSGRSSSVR